ncbi:DNA polymerase III subunit alpha [Dissulfurimicrobium hydrothermale]|uniref:DNA polymerase III subunit alpha n=1 Tax=Dissulfurimicrobium hydrothermale TaxID=1750598 RepID=UPI001EDAEFBC|nr:DNA polymerase III subunit alpha [Dissulfurimicrobium hydrothermale]UKL13972.1 DNA polymerase III subunit alpha [Dissulfurimicrobium hydrothermale]
MNFTHLHLHTEYSLLDGAIRLKDLFPTAKKCGYEAVAMTDHGNMYGALNFYEQAMKHDIKPILGCEMYVAPKGINDKGAKGAKDAGFHLVLLAQDNDGYKNLLRLVSIAHLEGFYYKPRVDLDLLKEYNKGLIALSACLHGEVAYNMLHGGINEARKKAQIYARIFDGRFYLELQENGIPEQAEVNKGLMDIGRELGLPIVATNDCHYLNAKDAIAHDVLLCIQTNRTINDKGRMRFSTDMLYFAPPEEMARRFSYAPEALSITKEIVERCNVTLESGRYHFPVYPIKETESYDGLFEAKAREGFEKRAKELGLDEETRRLYLARLEEELEVIKDKGFASYFLIVADFINWAKSKGIPVGPGRGSAAGSLTAYSMGITELDPVRYGLYFERFLNAERASLPDIDVDFCMNRRDEVLDYVTQKYGGEGYVAQIITFGQMKARAVIRDVGRGLGMQYPVVDRIAKLVPATLNITLDKAIEQEPRFKELAEKDEQVAKLLEIAKALEGLPRHASTHAAGVVISDRPMVEHLPLTKGQKGETVTQFDMKCVEKVGLIKFDFLGLKTLTVIDDAIKIIKKHLGVEVDINKIPLDDTDTYELLSRGDTTGVFQLESPGMKDLIRKMRPSIFTDLIALVALYRPGPLESGMVDQFVKAKHGEIKVKYLLPELEPILNETYGVIVYQEQVMKIAQTLAGYSLGEGDLLRRAMGKKKPEEMAAQRDRFISGAKAKGIPGDKAATVFDLMEKFAGYGFNKSHSAAYALIAYQTAWLKTHYRAPFLASLLSNELGDTDGVVKYISECKTSGVKVLPPDINRSDEGFTLDGDAIRFGLAAVKNVGVGAIESIIKERGRRPYDDFEDFCSRVDLRKVNKRVIESLIKCGAFDSLGHKRSQLMEVLDQALDLGQAAKKAQDCGQKCLFDGAFEQDVGRPRVGFLKLPNLPEWPESELLSMEKEALGFHISGHPLDPYRDSLQMMGVVSTEEVVGFPDESRVALAGIIKRKKEIVTKKGERMAFLLLEDLHGSIEVVCFPELYTKTREALAGDQPIWVKGSCQRDDDEAGLLKIIADAIEPLEEIGKKKTTGLIIELNGGNTGLWVIEALKDIITNHPGACPIKLAIAMPGKGKVTLKLPESLNVALDNEFSAAVNNLVGYNGLQLEYGQV